MLDSLSVTETLGVLIGVYMLAGGIGLYTMGKDYGQVITEMRENIGLSYIAAVIAFVIGAAIVAVHNEWSSPLAIVVSVIGWAGLIEGVLLLAFREPFLKLIEKISFTEGLARWFGIGTFVFGAWMIYMALS